MATPIRVLILEDQPDDSELLFLELRRAGFDPQGERVDTEKEFMARLDSSLDVILSDFSLPGFNGLDALRRVKERKLEVPFIFVTGTMVEEEAVTAMRHGATDYLLKDRLAQLGRAVSQAIENRRLREEHRRAEQDARHFAAIVESSQDAVIGKTLDHIITSWNPAAERLYGWSREEVVGRSIAMIVPPERAGELRQIQEYLREGRCVDSFETVRVRKDGTRVDVSVAISPIKDAAGRVIGASAITRDITERKRLDRQVRASELRFRRVFESDLLAMGCWAADGTITLANDALLRLIGYTPRKWSPARCSGRNSPRRSTATWIRTPWRRYG